jgi:hypothetical protein
MTGLLDTSVALYLLGGRLAAPLPTGSRYPSSLSYGSLKLLPFWDPLRGDPRFEKIVNSLAPK